MGWSVSLNKVAEDDLEAAVAFIAQKSPEAANRIGQELIDVIFSLDHLPSRGALVRGRPGLRKLIHRDYLIVYKMNSVAGMVEVVRVWDARKDPKRFRA